MPFGNISTLYLPAAANAGTSQWGADVRKLLSAADATSDTTTTTEHGTGATDTVRTFDPYTASSTDAVQADLGWAVTPTDMGSVAGALRFYPAGNHTLTARMGHNGALLYTGTLAMFVYRVGSAAGGRTRTLLGSSTASVSFPATSGEVTATCTVALPEVAFAVDETIQYSLELTMAGVLVTGHAAFLTTGTKAGSGVVSRIDTPVLKVRAETTGTATGLGIATGDVSRVLGVVGTATGTGDAVGTGASRADATGTATGLGTATGSTSAVAGTIGTASGLGEVLAVATAIGSMTGAATGVGDATGEGAAVGGMTGTATGLGIATGAGGAVGGTTGTATGVGTAAGLMSSISGTVGTASGLGVAAGVGGAVIGAVGTVEIGSGAAPPATVIRPIFVFDD